MNTPTLLSIISSSVASVDQARGNRAADPAHGLDFSKLLGERRIQASAAPAVAPRPSQPEARRSNVPDAPARAENGPARQNDAPRDSVMSKPDDARPSAPASNDKAAPEAGSRPDKPVAARDDAGTQPTTDTPAPAPAEATPGDAAPDTDTGTQAGAQLAQNAAEAGLAALVSPSLAAQPGRPAATEATTALPGQTAHAGAAPAAGTANPNPALAATLAGHDADLQTPLAAQAGESQRLAAGQQAPASQTGITLPATPAAALVQQAIGPLETAAPATPAAVLADAPTAASQPAAAQALPLPVATDMAGSAAARSLQDFTAMVAAARATSGTVLAPAAQASQPVLPAAPFALAGAMPAGGLLPGQAFPGAAPLAAAGIAAPLGSPQWPTELGRQFINITQAANGLGQVAELRLDPPDLGPLRITINLSDNVAHAVFSSPHALVRQTVENALPQLQQMLEQAGISLGQANVNDQHQSGQASQQQAGNGRALANAAGNGAPGNGSSDTDASRQNRPADPSALVDTFA